MRSLLRIALECSIIALAISACSSTGNGVAGALNELSSPRFNFGVTILAPCPKLVVGQESTITTLLSGGRRPYKVTWYRDGRVDSHDTVTVSRQTHDLAGIPNGGLLYGLSFVPRNEHETVSVTGYDNEGSGVTTSDSTQLVGPGACQITSSTAPHGSSRSGA